MKKYSLIITFIACAYGWAGCQLIEAKNKNKENKSVLNSERLTGKWIQTGTKITNAQEGYVFKEGGSIEDINHPNYQTESWKLSDDTLTLSIKSHETTAEDTLTVVYKAALENDVLVLSSFDASANYQEVYIKAE